MGKVTGIAWTDHTWSPWRGCTKVSPGCANCYAEALSVRNPKVLGEWGPDGTRVVAADSAWRIPLKWDREAKAAGVRRRVFFSLGDPFEDRSDLDLPLARFLLLIHATPNLDWLLLTKRPERFQDRMAAVKRLSETTAARWTEDASALAYWADGSAMPNVWLGVSVEDQQRADERIPLLLQMPARVRFVSAEPLLGPIDLEASLDEACDHQEANEHTRLGLQWLIAGGESGPRARPCHVEWIRSLVQQCQAARVACFVKQLGSNSILGERDAYAPELAGKRFLLRDRKGSDPSEWPEDLQVQEFPE